MAAVSARNVGSLAPADHCPIGTANTTSPASFSPFTSSAPSDATRSSTLSEILARRSPATAMLTTFGTIPITRTVPSLPRLRLDNRAPLRPRPGRIARVAETARGKHLQQTHGTFVGGPSGSDDKGAVSLPQREARRVEIHEARDERVGLGRQQIVRRGNNHNRTLLHDAKALGRGRRRPGVAPRCEEYGGNRQSGNRPYCEQCADGVRANCGFEHPEFLRSRHTPSSPLGNIKSLAPDDAK